MIQVVRFGASGSLMHWWSSSCSGSRYHCETSGIIDAQNLTRIPTHEWGATFTHIQLRFIRRTIHGTGIHDQTNVSQLLTQLVKAPDALSLLCLLIPYLASRGGPPVALVCSNA